MFGGSGVPDLFCGTPSIHVGLGHAWTLGILTVVFHALGITVSITEC